MKKSVFLLAVAAMALTVACTTPSGEVTPEEVDPEVVDPVEHTIPGPITASSPTPTEQITKVSLDATQKGYVEAGNGMAFRFLEQMYQGKNLILSPLSLQYALAMTANGASGETLQEIIDFLGYGAEGIDVLNAYCKTLLEQLPAVDLEVSLKLTDALLVNDQFPLLESFQQTVRENYYAAVENMDFSDPDKVASAVNDWVKESTNGFIDRLLDPSEISPLATAFIMNALYFKAKWAGSEYSPMFAEYNTTDQVFTLSDGSTRRIPMMFNMRYHLYAEMDGYKVLALPYAGRKFYMYILLPDTNNLQGLMSKLPDLSWKDIRAAFKQDAEVYVRLPKFDVENKFMLKEALMAMGLRKAFVEGVAEFDAMFQPKAERVDYWIEQVIQKARISVDEWGTEAAAVTVVEMAGSSAGPGEEEPKRVYFYADHPFVFLIGEATSGTILFEGAFTGKE